MSPKIINVIEPLTNLFLREEYSLVQKWNYMNYPDEPDHRATKNRYLRSLDWILKEGRPVPPPNLLEERNQSVPRKDSQPFKDLGKTNPVVKTFPSDEEETT